MATVLAGWPGEVVERDRIVAAIWGDNAPATAINTLQVHISNLRRLIGKSTIAAHPMGYVLQLPPPAVDAEEFVTSLREAAGMRRREHYARAAELLARGVELWRGTPFLDIDDPDLNGRRGRLAELRDQAREDLVECRLELCRDGYDLADVIADARELVSRQPHRERGHVLLVRALMAAHRLGEASVAFEQAVEPLRETMGLDPGMALTDVYSRGLNYDPSIRPRAMRRVFVLPDGPAPTAGALAVAADVRSAVVDAGARLVSLVVPDGVDADELALVVARGLEPDMPVGVRLLDGVPDESLDGTLDIVTGTVSPDGARAAARRTAIGLVALVPEPLRVDGEVVLSGSPARVRVRLVNGSITEFVVDEVADGLEVRAHTGLSAAQVESACAELGDDGPDVLAAWRQAVGLRG